MAITAVLQRLIPFKKQFCLCAGIAGLLYLIFAGSEYREQLHIEERANVPGDLHSSTPSFISVKPIALLKHPSLQDVFSDPRALTIWCNKGRLGNQMGTYSTLYGIAALNNRDAYFQKCNTKHLHKYFQISGREIELVPNKFKRSYPIGSFLREWDEKIPPDVNILEGDYLYPNSFTFFQHVQDGIRREFRFHDSITQYAQNLLWKLRGTRETVTFVGIHVRRGDYGYWLSTFSGKEVDHEYFELATAYFRKKFPDALFIAVSDDRKWCRDFFSNLTVTVAPPSPDAGHDMAILVNCNHTIITYGTYGFWAAYLTGGETVYYDDYLMPGSDFLVHRLPYNVTFLPNWIGINNTKPGFWAAYRKKRRKALF